MSAILADQSHHVDDKFEFYNSIRASVGICKELLLNPEAQSLRKLGEVLEASWDAKKNVSAFISSDLFDELYRSVKACGSYGGKVSGAGGGGFLMALT